LLGIGYNSTTRQNYLASIDPATGATTVLNSFVFSSGGWLAPSLTAANGNVYALSSDSHLYDFDATTGAIISVITDNAPGTLQALTTNVVSSTAALPDLIVSRITPVTTAVQQGGTLNFSYVVKNQGSAAAGASWAGIYLDGKSASNELTGSAGYNTISGSASGAAVTVSNSFGTAGLSPGLHTLWIKADYWNSSTGQNGSGSISESNEANNWLSASFTVTASPPSYNYTTFNVNINNAVSTYPTAINDSGRIVGYETGSGGFQQHGFSDNGGNYSTVDFPNAPTGHTFFDWVTGINASGQIVGYYQDNNTSAGTYTTHGFLDIGGSFTRLDDPVGNNQTHFTGINAGGQIVGWYDDSRGIAHGFLYSGGTNGSFTPLDYGSSGTTPTAINSAGQVVGYYQESNGTPHGFLYTSQGFQTLDDTSGSGGTTLTGINDAGLIVGYDRDSNGSYRGFVYDGSSFMPLRDSLGTGGGTVATGINNAGQVVGYYYDSHSVPNGFVASPAALMVNAGTTVELGTPYSGAVTFAANTGTLKLDTSSSFSGTVAGMTVQDTIDFADINPTNVHTPTYSGNSSSGTLSVTDGTHIANITLLGNYLASTFIPSSDGHGGTNVIDPPATDQPALVAQLHA
jgi:probable HAF family extracellular repeat protein